MKVKRIAILSVLKPVDDTRMYHKIGRSLQQAGFEIHIAGFKGNITKDEIRQYPIFDFSRVSMKRILAPVKSFFWLLKINPALIIVTTHELLFPCVLYKIFSRKKLIYDIQENYFLNISRTNAFPPILRIIISNYVKAKEQVLSQWIDHFFLAERGYKKELSFLKNKFTILENKAIPSSMERMSRSGNNGFSNLIFTGTIAETTGVFECIEMAHKLHLRDDKIKLHIIGACHLPEIFNKLKKIIAHNSWITLTGGKNLVPYSEVVKAMESAHAGLIYYPDLTLIENTIPTKLYEYLWCRLPIILQDKKEWITLAQKYDAAVPVSIENFDAASIMNTLNSHTFYATLPGDEVLWDGEAKKMLSIIDKYIT